MPDYPPIRVAVIGSGPAGFYAAGHLLKESAVEVEVDMLERLPTPWGLVRSGVAPDHPKIKSVSRVYEKTAAHPRFRYFGNVTLGEDISREDLLAHYHAVVYATGSALDRPLGIPGEDLLGSHAATEVVGWDNGHPHFRDLEILRGYAEREPTNAERRVTLRFLLSPVELIGDESGRVAAVEFVRNELTRREDGSLRAQPTDERERIECELVFGAIGYRGLPLPDLPFDESRGIVPTNAGRGTDPASG